MNNHLNMLPKQAKFDLKCFKMRWELPQTPLGELTTLPNPLIVRKNPSHDKFLATPLISRAPPIAYRVAPLY